MTIRLQALVPGSFFEISSRHELAEFCECWVMMIAIMMMMMIMIMTYFLLRLRAALQSLVYTSLLQWDTLMCVPLVVVDIILQE
jgi:hypothetical protein